ncbi:hypothetical protein EMIHUDRAFT_434825 [Emiliania huxleyi CCMP1516]|uniref:Uncharacterized protein n=2 Tax=Emiliania huxleyi TaxID=2903 RepID=A0A0D3JYH6_EMIH1|nr:hypothetical protein EMIHUDRAFT_434825 [Emiliania huxleyi CCMP1516]EOD28561.1 hypothetical protein EMIHUDRAFT_434825 [Emiliania huxleyi CCMP1516]|eukprot:XP_005780990.1 hypothetical protein EMIHUDRAFT_434825 [Emiliania huxleyi CCMP1516]
MCVLITLLAAAAGSTARCEPTACGQAPAASASCPLAASSATSDVGPQPTVQPSNLYFFNAAGVPVTISYVAKDGSETTRARLAPGLRRLLPSLSGEVWRVRALRPGHPLDQQLLLEHRVGIVQIKDCDCPQPEFVDCQKPPFRRPPGTPNDPVAFENHAGAPLDLFYWNGTCEEMISWDAVGGVQPAQRKPIQSTHGHTFRARSAASRHLLMQHTLADLVIRPCDDETRRAAVRAASPRAIALRRATADLEQEQEELRAQLEAALAALAARLAAAGGAPAAANATTTLPLHSGALGSGLGLGAATKARWAIGATGASLLS